MKLPSFLASDNALEGFLKGFFAPVYLLMSFFEKKQPEVKQAECENIYIHKKHTIIVSSNEKKSFYFEKSESLISLLEDDYAYASLLASRLNNAILENNAFQFRIVLGQLRAQKNENLPEGFVALVASFEDYTPIIEKMKPLVPVYKNTHLQAMENVMAFHADSFKPYKKLVDAHEKAK